MPILITLFVGAVAGIIVAQIMKLEVHIFASMAIGVIGALGGFLSFVACLHYLRRDRQFWLFSSAEFLVLLL